MESQLQDLLAVRGFTDPLMIGIHTGGLWVAQYLHAKLGIKEPLASLDISFYRDDFSRIGMHPQVRPSNIPTGVENRNIILVDDVLYTGRTIRAALNELFDYGRPTSVSLAVLIDRGGRELPIEAQAVGEKIELKRNQQIKLQGPETLSLRIEETG
jgi:pyrimidine operon attenuation protein/uracil phosphoribosyltransferase